MSGRVLSIFAAFLAVCCPCLPLDNAFAGDADRNEGRATRASGVLHFRVSEVYLDFETEFDWRRVHYLGNGRESVQKNRDLLLEESIGFRFDGDIKSPNLITWSGEIELGLSQSRFVEHIGALDNTDSASGTLLEYDVSADIFRSRPLSFHAFARRLDQRVPRRFLPSLREDVTEYGVVARALGLQPVTTEIGFTWRDVDRRGNRNELDDEDMRFSRFYIDSDWKISRSQHLHLTYDHENERSTYQGSGFDFDTRRDELRLDHELLFGERRKHRLDTFLRYNEEHGDLARDEFELTSRLSLKHTDTFSTSLRYGFYRYEQDAIKVDLHRVDVEALYKPTKELRLTLDAFGQDERIDNDVDTDEFGGGFDVAYNRSTPSGELSVNLAFAYDRARTTGSGGRRVVRDEAHVLGDVRPVVLRQGNISRGGVLAHNLQRTRYYAAGVDYLVSYIRDRVSVRRLPTGRITEGEIVYFDYEYSVPTRSTVDSYRADFLIEHSFDLGLTPYYYLESRWQDIEKTSIGLPLRRDNMHRHRLGLRYDGDRWSLGGEFEVFDDDIEPYDAGHITGRVALLRGRDHTLDLMAELSRYFFEGGLDKRNVWWLDVDLNDRLEFGPNLFLDSTVGYRFEDDSRAGRTNAVDLSSTLLYSRNSLNIELTVEYDLLSLPGSRENGLGVFLQLRRDFSHLLPGSGRMR